MPGKDRGTPQMNEPSWKSILPPYLHVLQVPTPFPVGPVNLYLAEGETPTLVDIGPRYAPAREALEKALAARGFRLADLGRLVLTHAHSDHYGQAGEIVEASGAES
ncbi:MAG: MBL fold metallo-hydrolase [Thermoflexia bacterium]|nr:MAG: MBL fold metallo-hydrolase [Thermoflexia bacterium]